MVDPAVSLIGGEGSFPGRKRLFLDRAIAEKKFDRLPMDLV